MYGNNTKLRYKSKIQLEPKQIRNSSSVNKQIITNKSTQIKARNKIEASPIKKMNKQETISNIATSNKYPFLFIDLYSLFFSTLSTFIERVEKVFSQLAIKAIFPGGSLCMYKCEKSGVKFDLLISGLNKEKDREMQLLTIQMKKKQGNNHTYKEYANSIIRKLNE